MSPAAARRYILRQVASGRLKASRGVELAEQLPDAGSALPPQEGGNRPPLEPGPNRAQRRQDEREIKRARKALDRAVRELGKVSPLLLFVPSPVFAEVVKDASRRILIRAANRIGKTRHLAYIAARRMVALPGYRVRAVGPTHKHVHKVFGRYLAEFLEGFLDPGSYYVKGKGWNGGTADTVVLANGSICELKSLKDDPGDHSGDEFDLVVMDEPPTLSHYLENMARLVTGGKALGQLIVGATMVNRPVRWLRLEVEGEEGPSPTEEGRYVHASGWVQYVFHFTAANCPWYSLATIKEWLSTVATSPWQAAQRVLAAWEGAAIDRLFVSFTQANVHDQPPEGVVQVGFTLDHGEVAGKQAILLAVWRRSKVYILDVFVPDKGTTPEEDAYAMRRMLRRHGMDFREVDLTIGDTNTVGKGRANDEQRRLVNDVITDTVAKIHTDEHGHGRKLRAPFRVKPANKAEGSVEWGWRIINRACKRGDLVIHPRCTLLIDALRLWNGKKTDEPWPHLIDALRYLLMEVLGRRAAYSRLRLE